jgi:hypothetical protein
MVDTMVRLVGRRWYAEYALLRQTEEAEMLVGMLGGLAGVDFALPVDNPQLDAARPASASAALYGPPPSLRLNASTVC